MKAFPLKKNNITIALNDAILIIWLYFWEVIFSEKNPVNVEILMLFLFRNSPKRTLFHIEITKYPLYSQNMVKNVKVNQYFADFRRFSVSPHFEARYFPLIRT